VNSWAQGLLFSEFPVLLWVPLRNLTPACYPNGDVYTPADIVIRECLGITPSPQLRNAVEAALADDTQVMWILDGYDEVKGHVPDQLRSSFAAMLSARNRVLTGRPNVMSSLHDPLIACDVSFQAAGFTDDHVSMFVEKFVRSTVGESELVSLPQALLSRLRQSTFVWELAHIPVNLLLMCHVFLDEVRNHDGGAPRDRDTRVLSLFALYERMETLLWLRYIGRTGVDVTRISRYAPVESLYSLPGCGKTAEAICRLAYRAMRDGIVMIDWPTVVAVLDETGVTLDSILSSGFVVQSGAQGSPGELSQFHFLHLTFQEYFAGKHVTSALTFPRVHRIARAGNRTAVESSSMRKWLQSNLNLPRMEVVWRFTAGQLAQMFERNLPATHDLGLPRAQRGGTDPSLCAACLGFSQGHSCGQCMRPMCLPCLNNSIPRS
jgi:hypothetical protein